MEVSLYQELPHEVFIHIFQYLDRHDLARCNFVCRSWRASANDDFLWRNLFARHFKLRLIDIDITPKKRGTWKQELQRLVSQVPSHLLQSLTLHTDEVLHVKFSHDGTELVSCSKDHTFIVWSQSKQSRKFESCYYSDMSKYGWKHTWAAQFNDTDTKLMVSGVLSALGGEIAVYDTGRHQNKDKHGDYTLLTRVVNDPYDMLGCWCSEKFFLSATISIHTGDMLGSIWLCQLDCSNELAYDYDSHVKTLFKFRSRNGQIYARFLQIHSRKNFDQSKSVSEWQANKISHPGADHQEIGHGFDPYGIYDPFDSSDDDDVPIAAEVTLPNPPPIENLKTETEALVQDELCIVFICSSLTCIPHQVGFQRILSSDIWVNEDEEQPQIVRNGAEKIIEMHGHIVGVAISPDQSELYVNVRSWPEGSIPNLDYPPCISSQIEMKVIDLETLEVRPGALVGHVGFTPSEHAFYLYGDVSEDMVGSGSEDKKGYIWDRHYQCNVARLAHEKCVNCVAFQSGGGLCATASDDCTIKLWQSAEDARQT